jgi:hypothetical protein
MIHLEMRLKCETTLKKNLRIQFGTKLKLNPDRLDTTCKTLKLIVAYFTKSALTEEMTKCMSN